jgi:AraC-like DNA-binding protein
MLTVSRFTDQAWPEDQRPGAWASFLAPLSCKVLADPSGGRLAATLNAAITPWRFALASLDMSAQRLTFDTRRLANGLWLLQVADGNGTLKTERGTVAFGKGDLLYGKTAREMALTSLSHVRLNCAFFPRSGSSVRLATVPTGSVASPLVIAHGSTAFLGELLRSAADKIATIGSDEIRPLETALTEFLFAAVLAASAARSMIDGSAAKNAILLRATQLLEAQLSDCELSPSGAARQLGISVRYLQKLFEEAGENVNHYIRRRRLECSYEELMDPLYFQQSIAEISFRWGFNDSAYFSRSFKDLFGLSPSQHRDSWRWHETGCGKAQASRLQPPVFHPHGPRGDSGTKRFAPPTA